jgi:hypothetical protein
VLSGTGKGADWLRAHARPGMTVSVSEVVSGDGATLEGGTGVVNGGPRLVEGGAVEITAFAEGFIYPENPEFYYRFGERRNPAPSPVSRGTEICSSSPWMDAGPATASAPASRRARLSWTPSVHARPSTSTVAAPRA